LVKIPAKQDQEKDKKGKIRKKLQEKKNIEKQEKHGWWDPEKV
jgi:hypothetical protein